MNNIKSKNSYNNNTKKKFPKYQKKITFKLIYDLYKSHFVDNCEQILLEKQNNFLDKFFNKMIYIIKNEFGDDIFEKNKSLYGITKKCENDFIKEVYWPMFDACIDAYEKYKSNKMNSNINYLTNFSPHCDYEQIALHTCGSKMIEIYITKKSYNINPQTYALCTGCKKCYFGNHISGYCPFEQKQYFLKIINNNNNQKNQKIDLEPATWEEYHCKNKIINEQMSCVRCGNLLYIKGKNLFCKNCKLDVDPLMIIWTCCICNQEFKSKAKKYNPLDFKEEENSIKEAFNYKIIVKPNELPCKCIQGNNLKHTNFYHNKKCKGLLYFGKLRKTDIVVCSECKCFYDIKKYLWCCPICEKNFGCKNICLNPKNNDLNIFEKIRNEKNKKNINISEKCEKNKSLIFLKYGGTPLSNNKFNLNISKINSDNKNIKSYIKKKPEDFYNYTNRNQDLVDDELSTDKNKKTRRNLSIVFKNRYLRKIFKSELNLNSTDKKDDDKNNNNNDKYYQTNLNFYKSNIISSDKNINNNIKKNNNSFINENNKYIITEKNSDKKYSKINFISNITPKIKTNRYCSISIRNYNEDENNHLLISDFNRVNNMKDISKEKKYKKLDYFPNNYNINSYQVYVPKRKFDLDNNNFCITTKNNNINNNEKNNRNNNCNGYIQYNIKKINTSNSVGIREKYKKIKNTNKDINLDYKRNIQTIFGTNENKEKENYSFMNTQKNFNINKINNEENNNNKEFYKSIRSSSQIRIDRNKNYLNHKYQKRYIGSKYNFNFNNNNSIKNGGYNIYQRRTANNLLTNKNMKDISTTNKSNGADSFILRNQFDNTKNNINTNNNSNNKNDILNPSLKNGNGNNLDNNKDIKDNKDNSELKEFNFNDYKIITQLGQGTFGKIYLVQDKNNQLFSMKKIILSEELDVQSVINEYKMCQKLIHENIVKILGIYNTKLDTTTYVVYILMEVGMTDWEKQISSYADKKIEYTEKNLINIIKQLSKVLSFLQKNNISHRDIKPQNILIFKNDIYKLADFGEAKQIDAMKNLLVNYSLRGTELYMSPLLFNGLRNGQIDIKHNLFKSDVYSLGLCILFAAVTSNKPLYEIRKFIDTKGVKKYLEKLLKEKYSYKFINLISSMLEIHEKNRPDFIELEKIMKKWK